MPNPFISTCLWSTIPVACLVISGVLARRYPPRPFLRSVILHFAGGVVFSVAAVELLPDIVKRHMPWEIALGFGLGVTLMLVIRTLAERSQRDEEEEAGAVPWGLITGIGVDVLVDGMLLGIVFSAGVKTGLLLALALAFELVSLGLALGAQFSQRRMPLRISTALLVGTAITFFLGALASVALTSILSADVLEIVLSFGLAALLFLVTEELLTEAHEEKEGPLQTGAFFVGFLAFLILGMVT